MTDFTLDDIEETFREDMRLVLARVDGAVLMIDTPMPQGGGADLLSRQVAFENLAACTHAVKGTAGLVGADGLAALAAVAEELAERGRDAAREARIHLERARLLGDAFREVANAIPKALTLELARKKTEAISLAAPVSLQARRVLGRDTLLEGPARASVLNSPLDSQDEQAALSMLDDGFMAIADETVLPGEAQNAPGFAAARSGRDALRQAFQSEAAAVSGALGRHLSALASDDDTAEDSKSAVLQLTNALFATASASDMVSTFVAISDARLATLALEAGVPQTIKRAAEAINILLKLAGAPEVEVTVTEKALSKLVEAPAPQADSDDLLAIFREELAEHAGAIEEGFGRLSGLQGEALRSEAESMRRRFHSLKGAAATVGDQETRNLSQSTERDLRNLGAGAGDAELLRRIAGNINAIFLRFKLSKRVSAPAKQAGATESASWVGLAVDSVRGGFDSVLLDAELLEVFQVELQGVVPQVALSLAQLTLAPDDTGEWESLKRILHQLKGAAATVGLSDLAGVGAELQAEAAAYAEHSPDALRTSSFAEKLTSFFAKGGVSLQTTTSVALPVSSVSAGARAGSASASEESISTALFQEQLHSACARISELAGLLGSSESKSHAALVKETSLLAHRTAGSARMVSQDRIGELAASLERRCERERDIPSLIAAMHEFVKVVSVPKEARSSLRASGRSALRAERISIEAIDSPELWEAFTQECTELLDELERLSLLLERSTAPKLTLKDVLRVVHTLKGAVNTMQILPTGTLLHNTEDFLERLASAEIFPAPSAVATVLLDILATVRLNVGQAREGFVSVPRDQLLGEMESLLGLRLEAGGASASERAGSNSAQGSQSISSESEGSQDTDSSSNASERRKSSQLVRVATKRLDNLMNYASELVINRSRVATRVSKLRGIVTVLDSSRRQLSTTVEGFREQHEFSTIRAVKSGTSALPQFGALELDRYDDVEILSRRLGEVGNDFEVLFRQFGDELRDLTEDADGFGTLVSGIQSEVTQARLTPLDLLFSRLRLPVRDAARRGQVSADVTIEGGTTLIDKTLADALFAPLLHIVRNSVAHGIESPQARMSAGKPEQGKIQLRGREDSGEVVIEVEDDGAGLNLEALRKRGIEMGQLPPSTPLDDARVREMIFVSGLSTKESAGDVAGRGLGGDIVKRAIERINGSVEVESSAGHGTLIRIRLPASLAITKVFIADVGQKQFAVPMFFAERILEVSDVTMTHGEGGRFVKQDGELLRAFSVAELTKTGVYDEKASGTLVVMRVGTKRFALIVKRVLAQEDAVIKGMGDVLVAHPLFAGVTVRGNGQLLLVLDVPSLADHSAPGATPRAMDPLPALQPSKTVALAQQPALPLAQGEDVSKRVLRVLYVDDSLSVRRVAEKMLQQLGVDVVLAVDGVDGLEKLRAGQFDLVFSDIEMPRLHGYELLREIRFLPVYKDLPVIMVTSRSGAKHRDEAEQAGASGYLTKPFNKQNLEDMIRRFTKKTQ
jgi:chemosensory pili system protein ChpA (sensor histidine kinase/response regulator)